MELLTTMCCLMQSVRIQRVVTHNYRLNGMAVRLASKDEVVADMSSTIQHHWMSRAALQHLHARQHLKHECLRAAT